MPITDAQTAELVARRLIGRAKVPRGPHITTLDQQLKEMGLRPGDQIRIYGSYVVRLYKVNRLVQQVSTMYLEAISPTAPNQYAPFRAYLLNAELEWELAESST